LIDKQQILQKYTYYYKRFQNCKEAAEMTSKKLLTGLQQQIRLETSRRREPFTAANHVVTHVVPRILEAREVLRWVYVLLYYMESGHQRDLLEHQQKLLMEAVEGVQDVLESKTIQQLGDLKSELANRAGIILRLKTEMQTKLQDSDIFDALLLQKADEHSDFWGCAICGIANEEDAFGCIGCYACKRHGEPECRSCNVDKKTQ
jgi:hypothetical protein